MKNYSLKNKATKTILSVIFFLFLFSITGLALAQPAQTIDYTPLAPLPGIGDSGGGVGPPSPVGNLSEYLSAIFRLAIGLAAVLAVLFITIGGFQYMSAESLGGKEAGREKINNALLGLFMTMGAWLFLYTLNPKLVEFDFNITPPPAADVATSTPAIGEIYKYSYCYNLGNDTPRISQVSTYPFLMDNQSSRETAENQCRNFIPQPGREAASVGCTNYRETVCTPNRVEITPNGAGWYKNSICQQPYIIIPTSIPLGRFDTEQECTNTPPAIGPVTPPRSGCETEEIECRYSTN